MMSDGTWGRLAPTRSLVSSGAVFHSAHPQPLPEMETLMVAVRAQLVKQ